MAVTVVSLLNVYTVDAEGNPLSFSYRGLLPIHFATAVKVLYHLLIVIIIVHRLYIY